MKTIKFFTRKFLKQKKDFNKKLALNILIIEIQ